MVELIESPRSLHKFFTIPGTGTRFAVLSSEPSKKRGRKDHDQTVLARLQDLLLRKAMGCETC